MPSHIRSISALHATAGYEYWHFASGPLYIPEDASHTTLFREMFSVSYRNSIKALTNLWHQSTFCFGGLSWRARMFIFIGHRAMTNELLNTEQEYNPCNRSDSSEAHTHTDREEDRQTASESHFFACKSVSMSSCRSQHERVWDSKRNAHCRGVFCRQRSVHIILAHARTTKPCQVK